MGPKWVLWVVLSSLFHTCHLFQQTVWLILGSNTSKKGYDKIPWTFLFLKKQRFLSVLEVSSDSNGKHGLRIC